MNDGSGRPVGEGIGDGGGHANSKSQHEARASRKGDHVSPAPMRMLNAIEALEAITQQLLDTMKVYVCVRARKYSEF